MTWRCHRGANLILPIELRLPGGVRALDVAVGALCSTTCLFVVVAGGLTACLFREAVALDADEKKHVFWQWVNRRVAVAWVGRDRLLRAECLSTRGEGRRGCVHLTAGGCGCEHGVRRWVRRDFSGHCSNVQKSKQRCGWHRHRHRDSSYNNRPTPGGSPRTCAFGGDCGTGAACRGLS